MSIAPKESATQTLTEPLSAIWTKLEGWGAAALEMLPNLGVAVVILLLTMLVSRLVAKWVCRGLDRTNLSPQLRDLLTSIIRVVIIGLGLVLALNALSLDKAVATALAGVGVVGLALGFAFQDIAANFMSGVLISIKEPFTIDQVIKTNDFIGTVIHIGLRATSIREFSGELVLIPNRKIFSEPLTNVSEATLRRIDIAVGVSYTDDLELVERTAAKAVSGLADCSEKREVQVLFQEFGSSSINLSVRFWVAYGEDSSSYLRGHSEAIKAIKKAFDNADISIPFPIRTLELGPEGVKTLRSELESVVHPPQAERPKHAS